MMPFLRLSADRTGSAATEMALATPLMLLLLFGTFELGYYFLSEHVVQKAVRDAARYAARLPISSYDCSNQTVVDPLPIQRLARSGDPDGDWNGDGIRDQRLHGWTEDAMTTVTVVCPNSASYHSQGIYADVPDGAPIITVIAAVPYPTLFGTIGLGTSTLTLNAQSQSAGFGA